jgi:hypothetical protein
MCARQFPPVSADGDFDYYYYYYYYCYQGVAKIARSPACWLNERL